MWHTHSSHISIAFEVITLKDKQTISKCLISATYKASINTRWLSAWHIYSLYNVTWFYEKMWNLAIDSV